jgi:hypothetical protein
MEDHSGHVAAAHGDGHVDRRGGELGVRVGVGEGEAEHAPAEQILTGRQEHRALVGVDLFEVAAPLLVGLGRVKVATD